MLLLYFVLFALLDLAPGSQSVQNGHRNLTPQLNESDLEQIRSPLLEVFMHLPSKFRDVASVNIRGTEQRVKRQSSPDSKDQRSIVDVRNYEITQPVFLNSRNSSTRSKREAEPSTEVKPVPILEKPEPEKLVGKDVRESRPVLPFPEAIRGPIYTSYPVKEFDIVDVDDPDDPRRRRNDAADSPDDNSQRDKRTFLEEGSGETTTPLPFWKRKKENPPFVTGRGGAVQSGNSYTPAQHRSAENARESHSLKNLEKTVQSNEISRSNQDNYYSSTNRRTFSRQYDNPASSTPKSVYDTIDYSKRNQNGRFESARSQDGGKTEFGRIEDKKETPREVRPTHDQYRQIPYSLPWVYDRPYSQPAYPYPTEVLGRGVEYYHRTYDPAVGRIIYYANMPEQGRYYDYRYMDPISRNFYVNRPYDPYYRSYVPPFDYRFVNGFGRSVDYLRNGRSSSQAYSYPFQEREKYPRDARFGGGFETGNRLKDDHRNKTYIIYDADERRSQFSRPQFTPDNNRPGYTTPLNANPTAPQAPFRRFPSAPALDHFPPGVFPMRNQFYPALPDWQFNHRSVPGVTDSNLNSRPLNSPEVQLPLTTSNRGNLDAAKKS